MKLCSEWHKFYSKQKVKVTYMKPAQYLVVVAFGEFDGRLMLLAVAVAEAAVGAVAAPRADTQADHSSQRRLACKATQFQRARPEKYGN